MAARRCARSRLYASVEIHDWQFGGRPPRLTNLAHSAFKLIALFARSLPRAAHIVSPSMQFIMLGIAAAGQIACT